MPNYVFCLDQSSETVSSAKKLATVDMGHEAHYRFFSDEKCFVKLASPKQFLFVGRWQENEDRAKQFVDQFVKRFLMKFSETQKNEVNDIYLLTAPVENERESFSQIVQDIADKLYGAGFHSLKIHAVMPPDNLEEAMETCVEFDNLSRFYNHHAPKVKPAIFNAYCLPVGMTEALSEYSRNPSLHCREINAIEKQRRFFIEHAHPCEALDLPQYIFIPNEKPEARKDRVRSHPKKQQYDQECELRDHAAEMIAAYTKEKENVLVKATSEALSKLAMQVAHSAYNTWRLHIQKVRQSLKSHKLVLKGDATDALLKKVERLKECRAKTTVASGISHLADARKQLQQMHIVNKTLKVLSKERDLLVSQLRLEIDELQTHCFSFFYTGEVITKQKKIQALLSLSFKDDVSMHASALKVLSDSVVMRSLKTTRTRDFLMKISHIEQYAVLPKHRNAI